MERTFSMKRFVNWTARLPMKTHAACCAIGGMLLSLLTANMAAAQLMPTCVENSPERRGELGCSIIENKLLPNGLKGPLFWHIDRFDSVRSVPAQQSAQQASHLGPLAHRG